MAPETIVTDAILRRQWKLSAVLPLLGSHPGVNLLLHLGTDAIDAGCLKRLVERRDLGHRVHDAEREWLAELLRDCSAGGALSVDGLAVERESEEG